MVFTFQGQYNVYLSVRWSYLGWYVGIKKSGKPKRGSKTWYPPNQKAIQFVARKQSPFHSFPDNFNFENENGTRVRRSIEPQTSINVEKGSTSPNALQNNENLKRSPEDVNHSPILFIDDEVGGIVDVTKTTTVNKVLQDLSQ